MTRGPSTSGPYDNPGRRGSLDAWPALPLDEWHPTQATLHRFCQMVGKVRLALAPFRNHWWHVTLYVTVDGLTTGLFPVSDGRQAEVRLDFRKHTVKLIDSLDAQRKFDLRNRFACAHFHDELVAALEGLDISADLYMRPYDLGGPAFAEDYIHDSYDAAAVSRFAQVLRSSTTVLEEFAGRFNGKQSPVHLFWHSFDLAYARFSGRRAPVREGAGRVEAEAYSHEVIAFGFWPGDDEVPYPAYYSYTAPAPPGLTEQPLSAPQAFWNPSKGTAILPYEQVRTARDPRATLLTFLEDAYLAGGRTAGWDIADLATSAAPPTRANGRPGDDMTCTHLQQLHPVAPATTRGCEECLATGDRWVHLRLCMDCGHVGCCDSSPNRHATAHATATGHPVIQSFEQGEDWAYCYPDDEFVDHIAEPLVRSVQP